ncbi:murein hydrolase activator EnvC family protein [Geoalkalibacter subterraneus]|uniref:M23ase beta-sheet core domain-containing protein n=1 Tax=Geoalkalibacter subterraneus TaxID=483547 RepID=A0A0B5FDI5_9BACT|nr:peptidoglycan DD-metalloendopeptidase family protein [Geoalkalibacter subterraneus]AJF06212.1 hypothetical protein GSUB_06115 [Geoalkalibacter subterraneus]
MPLYLRIFIILCFVFLTSLSVFGQAQDLAETRQTLERIQERIKSTRSDLEQIKSHSGSLRRQLEAVRDDLERLNRQLGELERSREDLARRIKDNQRQADEAQRRIEDLRAKVEQRLVVLYKEGESGPLSLIFSPQSPARQAEQYDYMARILEYDRELLEQFRADVRELEQVRSRLLALRDEQQQVLNATRQNRDTARDAARLQEQLLSAARQEQKALSSQLDELKDQARGLSELVKKLESQQARAYTDSGNFVDLKGHLPWPVEGRVTYGFGQQKHPQLGTTFDSHGIEIAIDSAQPVKAVADGRVIYANWFKGYGNLLILDHGNSYYTLYAQNARLTKGVDDVVARGETIGFSGLPGSNGIYFEIRKGGTPQDPGPWLRKR